MRQLTKRRHRARLLLVVGITVGLVIQTRAFSQDAQRFTLDQAIEHAWAHHPDVKIADEAVRRAEAQLAEARGRFFPSIDLTGSYTYNGKLPKQVLSFKGAPFPGAGPPNDAANPTDGPASADANSPADDSPMPSVTDPAASNGPVEIEFGTKNDLRGIAKLQWPIFTWGKALNGYHAIEDNFQAAQHRLVAVRRDVSLSVTEAFYGVLLTGQVVDVARQAVEQSNQRLKIAKARYEAGAATRLDVLQAEVALANAKTQAIRAENARRLARRAFALSLGLDPDADVTATGELKHRPVHESLEDLQAQALKNREDLQELAARRSAAERMVKVAKAGNRPNVALTGLFNWNDNEKQRAQTTWSVGIGVSVPLFDGFATRAKTHQAESSERQAELGVEAFRRGVLLAVQRAYLDFQEAASVLQAQQEALAQSEEALRIANLSFQNGVITSVELAGAELGRTQTKLGYLRALYDSVIARARLERAIGAPLP